MNWSHICSFVRATGIFCLVMTFAGSIATADLVYTITGTIPVGGSGNSQVSDGESFIATFYIDTSVPDGLPGDPNIGFYAGATTDGSLEWGEKGTGTGRVHILATLAYQLGFQHASHSKNRAHQSWANANCLFTAANLPHFRRWQVELPHASARLRL